MNARENLISLFTRTGFESIPVQVNLCPSLQRQFEDKIRLGELPADYLHGDMKNIADGRLCQADLETSRFLRYFKNGLKPGSDLSPYGVAREPGSEAALHMKYMRHPLQEAKTLADILDYPYPDYAKADFSHQRDQVEQAHAQNLFAVGSMQTTIWETAWYIRSMEQLMMDMLTEPEWADALFDRITQNACIRAAHYAQAGVDMIFLGDDVGMQHSIMMRESLYVRFLKPRMQKVIDAARAVNPRVLIANHADGYIEPFIPHLIEIGVDILNPVQPECMEFSHIHALFGDRLSFYGTIGTQTTMPFGSPQDVKNEVLKNLRIAGKKGGLLPAPTHMLEADVPWENICAYVETCRGFSASMF